MLTIQDWGKMIGRRCVYDGIGNNIVAKIVGVRYVDGFEDILIEITDGNNISRVWDNTDGVKPMLRSFKQLTDDEKKRVDAVLFDNNCALMDYLDSIGIDQRNWIENGLAIQEGKDEATKV